MIVGVSDEGNSTIEKWVAEKGVQYQVAQSSGSAAFDVNAYPTYYLVGPDGRIAAQGHPDEAEIEKHLAGVRMAPPLPDSKAFKPLVKAWDDGEFAKVHKALVDLEAAKDSSDEEQQAVARARKSFDAALQSVQDEVKRLGAGPDYFAAEERLKELAKSWKGLPPSETIAEQLARIGKEPDIKKELQVGKQLAQLQRRFDASKSGDRKKLVQALQQFVKQCEGTHAAQRAQTLLDKLR